MPNVPTILPLHQCKDLAVCGGKAVNLGRMLRAGLPVPDGFVVSTAAYGRWLPDGGELSESLAVEIAAAYRQLGSPVVAVRSSATAEDLAETSMAGQYDTLLGVSGEQALLDAVRHCWRSVGSERLRSYLAERGVDPGSVAMAVVVQRLVPADVAGVLFTANPRTADRNEMLIEAAWGLGNAVVSGMVQPDIVVIDRHNGKEESCSVADKAVWVEAGLEGPKAVDDELRRVRCLSYEQVRALWELGCRVAEQFGGEQDVEWAICNGQLFLLQSRAITTLGDAAAYRRCLDDVREQLNVLKAEGRGDWVRHNIAETLPHPTPLSWSVISRFMSGRGGFGELYRKIGFRPSERVCRDGFLELIAGRIYMDLPLATEMYSGDFPLGYDGDLLRCRPDAAQQPPTIPTGSWIMRAAVARELAAIERTLLEHAAECDRRLVDDVGPEFAAWVTQEKRRDLSALSTAAWRDAWTERTTRVMDRLAPETLLPSMIAAMTLERTRVFLEEHFWDERPGDLLNVLAVGDRGDRTIEANEALRLIEIEGGSWERWLADHGHRGPEEFDLAARRWREQPDELQKIADLLATGPSPMTVHQQRVAEADRCAARLRARLSIGDRREFDERLSLLRRYLPWREDGKALLMLGYDLLRDLALEAGRRLEIGSDVFLLTLDELCMALDTQMVPQQTIEDRRQRRAAERRVSLPLYLGPEEIENLGRRPGADAGRSLAAVPISTGVGTGAVRISHSPRAVNDLEHGYVLVCPSTDPSWTPLFAGAAGLILECGGMLSHGAVVAREMGIPAVVLPEATRLFEDGETITVDGQHGVVLREGVDPSSLESASADPRDVRIAPDLIPPRSGPGERRAATLRSVFFLIWGVYLAAVFLLPQPWCYGPSIELLDTLLWPLISVLGKPGAVVVIAVGLAALTMIGQRLLTDNRRLLAAKHRAGQLRREAAGLPVDSPRRAALVRTAGGVPLRLLGASFVPLAVLLGPMVMVFAWLPERVDPASWSPPPGAVAHVTATVDGEYAGLVRIEPDAALTLDTETTASQSLPPIRSTLTSLLAAWQEQTDADNSMSYRASRKQVLSTSERRLPTEAMIADLQQYLDGRMPAQDITWTIHTPPEAGRYSIALFAGDGGPSLRTSLVMGDRFPPEPKEDLGDGRGPLQIVQAQEGSTIERITVTYQFPRTLGDDVFFAPLRYIPLPVSAVHNWATWGAGWLLTYIAAYLLTLLPTRWLLRVP